MAGDARRISVIVRIEVKPDTIDRFPSAWDAAVEHVRANEPGTEHYMLHQAANSPNTFFVSEVYSDQAAFDAHIASDVVTALFHSLTDYIVSLDMDISKPIRSAKG